MRRVVDLGAYGMPRLVVDEPCPEQSGTLHQPTLSIVRTHHGSCEQPNAEGVGSAWTRPANAGMHAVFEPAVIPSIVGKPYLGALRDALKEAFPR